MQNSFSCSICSLSFVNKAKLKYHVRCYHQASVTISLNSQSKVVERSNDEQFHCLKCNKSSRDPRSIYRHTACFFNVPSHTPTSAPAISDSSSTEEEILESDPAPLEVAELSLSRPLSIVTINEYLLGFRLAYDPMNEVMICTQCCIILNDDYVEHARKIHSKVVHQELVQFISSHCPVSNFQVNPAFPIPALPYLPIVQGFQCPSCKWCCTLRRTMGEHYSKVHANNSYVQLSLQSISRGCCSTFFPVFSTPRPAVTEENFPDVSRIIEAVSAVARTPSLVPENDKTRNILYTTAGWFT